MSLWLTLTKIPVLLDSLLDLLLGQLVFELFSSLFLRYFPQLLLFFLTLCFKYLLAHFSPFDFACSLFLFLFDSLFLLNLFEFFPSSVWFSFKIDKKSTINLLKKPIKFTQRLVHLDFSILWTIDQIVLNLLPLLGL